MHQGRRGTRVPDWTLVCLNLNSRLKIIENDPLSKFRQASTKFCELQIAVISLGSRCSSIRIGQHRMGGKIGKCGDGDRVLEFDNSHHSQDLEVLQGREGGGEAVQNKRWATILSLDLFHLELQTVDASSRARSTTSDRNGWTMNLWRCSIFLVTEERKWFAAFGTRSGTQWRYFYVLSDIISMFSLELTSSNQHRTHLQASDGKVEKVVGKGMMLICKSDKTRGFYVEAYGNRHWIGRGEAAWEKNTWTVD